MKRYLVQHLRVGIVLMVATSSMAAKGADVSGLWDCQAHGGSSGDVPFTLRLHQDQSSLTGSISSRPWNGRVTSGSYHDKLLEVHFDVPKGTLILKGKLENGKLSGTWSTKNQKGNWTGTRPREEIPPHPGTPSTFP
jgi:hypothetical protein